MSSNSIHSDSNSFEMTPLRGNIDSPKLPAQKTNDTITKAATVLINTLPTQVSDSSASSAEFKPFAAKYDPTTKSSSDFVKTLKQPFQPKAVSEALPLDAVARTREAQVKEQINEYEMDNFAESNSPETSDTEVNDEIDPFSSENSDELDDLDFLDSLESDLDNLEVNLFERDNVPNAEESEIPQVPDRSLNAEAEVAKAIDHPTQLESVETEMVHQLDQVPEELSETQFERLLEKRDFNLSMNVVFIPFERTSEENGEVVVKFRKLDEKEMQQLHKEGKLGFLNTRDNSLIHSDNKPLGKVRVLFEGNYPANLKSAIETLDWNRLKVFTFTTEQKEKLSGHLQHLQDLNNKKEEILEAHSRPKFGRHIATELLQSDNKDKKADLQHAERYRARANSINHLALRVEDEIINLRYREKVYELHQLLMGKIEARKRKNREEAAEVDKKHRDELIDKEDSERKKRS